MNARSMMLGLIAASACGGSGAMRNARPPRPSMADTSVEKAAMPTSGGLPEFLARLRRTETVFIRGDDGRCETWTTHVEGQGSTTEVILVRHTDPETRRGTRHRQELRQYFGVLEARLRVSGGPTVIEQSWSSNRKAWIEGDMTGEVFACGPLVLDAAIVDGSLAVGKSRWYADAKACASGTTASLTEAIDCAESAEAYRPK